MGDFSNSLLESYQQALDIFRRQQGFQLEGDALGNMGWVYERLGQPQQALEYLQKALTAFTAQGDPDGLWRLHAYTARVLATLRDIPTALDHYAMAVRILDTLRGSLGSMELKISFLAADTAKLDVYREAVTLLLTLHEQDPTQGYPTKAFAYAERGKARALLDNLAEARAQLRTGARSDLLAQEQQLYDRLAAARQQMQQGQNETQRRLPHEEITALESELAALQQTLRTTNPRFAAWHIPEPVTLADVQNRVLHEGEVLLEYFWGTHALHLFIVDHTGLRASLTLPLNERELTSTLEQFLQPLRQLRHPRELQHFDLRLAHTLYRQVVQPVTPYLGTAKTLVVVPDGVLHYLPYELLVTSPVPPLAAPQDMFAAYGDASYLVRQYAIVYAPSASVLRLELLTPVAPTALPKILLALAPSIEDLQASQQEVLKLSEVFSRDVTTLLGSQATKEALRTQAQDYRYVHLATHGFVNENAPMYSALKLAQNNVLQTYEIFTLALRADLVTLSACETGLGAFKQGEGIVGLIQAFLYAGTPSVIASLWQVNDASTAELMTTFYQHLREGTPKGEALRQAKLAMIEKKSTPYVHPYFWAPFVLTGAWH
jgi:CHAT domain-containing protein